MVYHRNQPLHLRFQPLHPTLPLRPHHPAGVQIIIDSLNLHHGDAYGRGYYISTVRNLLMEALTFRSDPRLAARLGKRFPNGIQSFSDLCEVIKEIAKNHEEKFDALDLAFIIQSLTYLPQLNCSPHSSPLHAALPHSIQMAKAIEQKK